MEQVNNELHLLQVGETEHSTRYCPIKIIIIHKSAYPTRNIICIVALHLIDFVNLQKLTWYLGMSTLKTILVLARLQSYYCLGLCLDKEKINRRKQIFNLNVVYFSYT